jgi:hypothetical protein
MHHAGRLRDQVVEQQWIEALGAWPQLKFRFQTEDDAAIRTVELPFVPAPQNVRCLARLAKCVWRFTPGLLMVKNCQNSLFCIHSRTSASASSCHREHRSLTIVTSWRSFLIVRVEVRQEGPALVRFSHVNSLASNSFSTISASKPKHGVPPPEITSCVQDRRKF